MSPRLRSLRSWPVTIAHVFAVATVAPACAPRDAQPDTNATAAAPSGATPSGEVPALRLSTSPFSLVLTRDPRNVTRGVLEGDTTVRLLAQPNPRTDAVTRLCGVLATGSTEPVMLAWAWPIDTAAPRLAQRIVGGRDVRGVRFVVPGSRARYVFTGITRDGAQIVNLQWPVDADPARPVPVGAADSVVEAALRPSVFALDSLVAALTLAAPPDSGWPAAPVEQPLADARAVPDVRLFPVHPARLSMACPDITLALPMLARADHTVKVAVDAGDVITAQAGVSTGTVRIGFDEAPPAPESPAREAVTRASIQATATGEVTLRVRLAVLPKTQLARQTVLVRLQRTRPPS